MSHATPLRALVLRSALASCIAAATWGCDTAEGKSQAKPPAPPPPTVVVTDVVQRTVPIYAEFVAQTEARFTVQIRARVRGVLEEMRFKEGDTIEEGQVLYQLETDEYDANLEAAQAHLRKVEADLQAAKARLGKAEQDVARYRPLAKARAVPQQDLDTALAAEQVARAEVDQAAAAIEQVKAEIIRAELDLGYTTIRSPLAGRVGRTEVDVGNLVGDGEPTLLCTVSSVDPIRVKFSIPEVDYLRLMGRHADKERRDLPIALLLSDGSTYAHEGHFVFAERTVDLETGTLVLVAEFPNPEGLLRPGQFGRVRVEADEVKDALLVPQKAVQEVQGAKAVLVVGKDDMVALRSIKPGPQVDNLLIVREGVEPGERVIVEGVQKARPGTKVAPTTAQGPGAEGGGGGR
ncbi:MAG: efflux RND transporter periplasmic adaptor subunit [Planctomycetota bacterium]